MNTAFKATLIAAAIAAVGAPAMAQDFGHRGFDNRGSQSQGFARVGYDLFQRIDRTEARIERARADGAIGRREARAALGELRDIREDLSRATRGRYTLSPVQHARFEQRIDRVGGHLRDARDDHHGRPYFRG